MRIFLVCIAILGAWFGFANPILQLPLVVLFYPASLALLAYYATNRSQAFWWSTITSGLASAFCLYWITIPVHDFGGLPWILAIFCPLFLGIYVGVYSGLFCLSIYSVADRLSWWAFGLFAGAVWAILEALRGWLFTGFTWLTLPSAFVPWPAMIQTAALWGGWGLSTLLVAISCLLVPTLYRIIRTIPKGIYTEFFSKEFLFISLIVIALLTSLWLLGNWRLSLSLLTQQNFKNFKVGIVQGNIDQHYKWNLMYQQDTIERYATLSRQLAAKGRPQLILWPETAMPFFFQEKCPLSDMVRHLAVELNIPLLIGAPGYINIECSKATISSDHAKKVYALFNRAWLIDTHGCIASYYDKEHLVPFGEYMPFYKWLQYEYYFAFITKLLQSIGDFTPGSNTAPLDLYILSDEVRLQNPIKLGILICYETIFPELAQKRVVAGATLLVNISNDAWFGHTIASQQHLQLSALRAIEQGRYIVRATNTGISAVIDPQGRISQETKLFEATTIIAIVKIIVDHTIFHCNFIIVLPCLSIIIIICFIWAWVYPGTSLARSDLKV